MKIKSTLRNVLCLCVILGSILSPTLSIAETTKLVFVADYWCPYSCKPGDLNPGYLVEVTKKAFEIYGIEIEYQLLPWHEALSAVEAGKVDGIFGINSIDNRNLILPEEPQVYSIISVFSRNDNDWFYDEVDSLKGKKIVTVLDRNLGNIIEQYMSENLPLNQDMFVIEDGKMASVDAINDLLNNKVDVYIQDQTVVNYYLSKNNLSSKVKNAGKVYIENRPVYIGFSAKLPDVKKYVKMLEDGIASIEATGELDDIKKKYQ